MSELSGIAHVFEVDIRLRCLRSELSLCAAQLRLPHVALNGKALTIIGNQGALLPDFALTISGLELAEFSFRLQRIAFKAKRSTEADSVLHPLLRQLCLLLLKVDIGLQQPSLLVENFKANLTSNLRCCRCRLFGPCFFLKNPYLLLFGREAKKVPLNSQTCDLLNILVINFSVASASQIKLSISLLKILDLLIKVCHCQRQGVSNLIVDLQLLSK